MTETVGLRLGGGWATAAISGETLAGQMRRAFGTVVGAGAGPAQLAIELRDQSEVGAGPPAPDESGWSTGRASGGELMRSAPDGSLISFLSESWRVWLSRSARPPRLTGAVRSAREQTRAELGRPLNGALLHWHRDRELPVLHASLVCRGDAGALILGGEGSGKSTTLLASLAAGLEFVGDDYVSLEAPAGAPPRGHGIYGIARVAPDAFGRFDRLPREALPAPGDPPGKARVYVADVPGFGHRPTARIAALVLPRVTGAVRTRIRRASAAEALRAVAPTSMLWRPLGVATGMDLLGRLVESCPAHWLEAGSEMGSLGEAVGSILEEGE